MRDETRKVLSESGKKGAEKRWAAGKPEPTKTVRVYVSDATRLAQVDPKAPNAIRKLLDERGG